MPGGIFHVYARGNDRREIFVDDRDRRGYLDLLARVVERHGWLCLMYCLMANHVHLLVQTPKPNLGRGMQMLHGDYARAFNVRHRRVGHLFQGRYGATRVEDDAQLWMTVAYVALNPVEARLCKRPEEWVWSSHAAVDEGRQEAWLASERLDLLLGGVVGGDDGYERCVMGAAGFEPATSRV